MMAKRDRSTRRAARFGGTPPQEKKKTGLLGFVDTRKNI